MMRNLITISPAQRARAERHKVRMDSWPAGARPGDSTAFCATLAPLCLPIMFERAEAMPAIPGFAPTYRLETWEPVYNTVRLDTGSWRWVVGDGSAQGRGLVSLWVWRFEIAPCTAHAELMAIVTAHEAAGQTKNRRKAA